MLNQGGLFLAWLEGAMFGPVGVWGGWFALGWDLCLWVAQRMSCLHGHQGSTKAHSFVFPSPPLLPC